MILDFFNISAHLKDVPRQGWIDKLCINKPESVADHTFSMAMIGMIFSDLENYNTEKILKMILLHDLAESVVGDKTPEQISKEEKKILENKAIEKILSNLPLMVQNQYKELWKEYMMNESKEAKIIHQIDKLEMALQAKIYSNKGYSKEKIETFFKSAKNEITEPKLVDLLKEITKNA